MLRFRCYVNKGTDEVTCSRREAMSWVENGFSVEIWLNGKRLVTLNPVL